MPYDPTNSARNAREATEYAGRGGSPQLKADGHMLTPAEKRRMIQGVDMATANVMRDLPPTDEHYAAVPEAEAKVRQKLRDYDLGDALA